MLFHFTDIVLCSTSPLTSTTVIPNHFYTQAVSAHVGFGFILNVYAYEEKKIDLNDNIMFDLMYTANIWFHQSQRFPLYRVIFQSSLPSKSNINLNIFESKLICST